MGWLDWIVPGTSDDKEALGVAKWLVGRSKARKEREAAEQASRDAEERETEKAIKEALGNDDDKEDA